MKLFEDEINNLLMRKESPPLKEAELLEFEEEKEEASLTNSAEEKYSLKELSEELEYENRRYLKRLTV